MITRRSWQGMLIAAVTAVAVCGCASGPYQYGRGWHDRVQPNCTATTGRPAVEVQYGRPNKYVDGAGWWIGLPTRIALWDHRVNDHNVSPETVASLTDYLQRNELSDVCIRVNQYDPADEWRRLRENQEIGAGWRYTAGVVHLAGYALLPGRILGGDRYNPYTNSVYLFSDVPSLAMQSAAYSKDVHHRDYPGTYAAVNDLPVLSLWHETIATQDALQYVAETGTADEQAESKRVLYPYYGLRVGGAVSTVVNFGPLFELPGAAAGHIAGRVRTSENPPVPPESTPPAPPDIIQTNQ